MTQPSPPRLVPEELLRTVRMLLKMPQKLLKTANFIELGSYQHWPVLITQRIRLYTYEQIPLFLRENPFITDGYRAHLPSKLCLRSIFMLSNETVNIWSHLLGFLLFFYLAVNDLTSVLPASGVNREDYVIYAIGLFCFQVCMLCSVGYHLFSCHRSEKTCRRWLSLDYAGISVGILGCYVPGIFYAFYCNAFWRQLYLLTVLSLILAVFCAQVHPRYLSNDWKRIRMAIFCCVAGISVVPSCHWVGLNGGLSTDVVQLFLPRILVMYLIAGTAFLFYVTKIPERYFPGQLNYLGASHQVWHVLVVLMFYWWHQTAVHIMQFRHSRSCPRTSSS
ncbi:progestin and adipoQ receptor family member 3-like [Gymnodraco acuticeps]|uniref:Progestin and adipoQ receptor family member 3-like n=1 Tax=Gymnodraco acuticeps TaxID=8218 RepID=A0A6P8V4H3_GYMAC|nr:progestin and adipoQ receptor family member 3-like [Gymnodraco acuticeps]